MANSVIVKIDGDDGGFKNAMSGIGTVAKKGFGIAVKGIAATSAALGGLSALAVKSYAQYEQLIGGVDTLFKTSSEEVQKNAAKAYKTAGLSVNEYMETAMGFAASLKQSFDDSEEGLSAAAAAADQAVIDMSDNANKMGTSMELIQNAYQGFAKQNYTMLDNLKLGYGGTKTEMERLLTDAQKLSGVKYDISNLADVYEAIHVIQTELGITGTTAKEASETISGSIGMMKASLENLIVGLADGNADIDKLVQEFIDSVLIVGENLIPTIETTLNGVSKFITKAADKLIPQIVDIIISTLPGLVEAAVKLVKSFGEAIIKNAPKLIDAAKEIVNVLIEGVESAIPAIKPFTTILKMLVENFEAVAVSVGIVTAAIKVYTTISNATKALTMAWTTALTALNTMEQAHALTLVATNGGLSLFQTLVGLLTGKLNLQAAATGVATKAQTALNVAMSANPIGLAVVAVAALAAAVVGATVAYDNYLEKNSEIVIATQNIVEASEAAVEKTQELSDALQSINGNAETTIMNAEAEAYAHKKLTEELYDLAEKTSLTTYEKDRMQSIVNELNEGIDDLNLSLDTETGKLNLTEDAVKKVIEQKLELAKTNAIQELYTEQLKKQYQAESEAIGTAKKLKEAQDELNKIKSEGTVITRKHQGVEETHISYTREQQKAIKNLEESIANYSTALGASTTAVNESHENMQNLATAAGVEIPESFKTAQTESKGFFDALLVQTSEATEGSTSKGNDFGTGYAVGISEKNTEAYQAGYNLGLQAVQGTKDAQNSNSPAKETIDLGEDFGDGYNLGIEGKEKDSERAGESLVQSAIKGIKNEDIDKAVDEVIESISQSDYKRKLNAAKSSKEIQEIKKGEVAGLLKSEREYLAESARIQFENDEREYKERLKNAKSAEEIEKVKQERIQEIAEREQEAYLSKLEKTAEYERKIFDASKKYVENRIEEIEDLKNEISDKLKNYGDLYYTYELPTYTMKTGEKITPKKAVLSNISKQNDDLRAYADMLQAVKERGEVPQELFAAMRDMSVEDGKDFATALLEADDETFAKYISDWTEKQSLSDKIAETLAADESEIIKKEFETQFGQLPEEFFAIGEKSAVQYGDGFLKELSNVFENVRQSVQTTLGGMIASTLSSIGGNAYANSGTTNNYSATYNILPSKGESTQAQLKAVEDYDTLNKARGGY